MYFAVTIAFMVSVRLFMPTLLNNLRKFERDCEEYDAQNENRYPILPKKETATDDAGAVAERTDRSLMSLLYGLPKDSVMKISP